MTCFAAVCSIQDMTKKKAAKVDRRFGPRALTSRKGTKPVQWHNVAQGDSPTVRQLKAARLYFGLTQTQAAELIGYTLNGWQRLEQGERTLKPKLWEFWLGAARTSASAVAVAKPK
jgi:DNA-binding XRE family transcriptional regulator